VFGAQTRSRFARRRAGLPAADNEKVRTSNRLVYELLWFLRGDTNIRYLNEHGVTIWNEWADENGELGRVYGAQWRDGEAQTACAVDQIDNLMAQIKSNPQRPAAN